MTWDVQLVEIEVTDDDVEAVLDCLRSGWLTMGPRTQTFESELTAVTGTEHAIAVSSGTAALHLACRAVGLGPGDEVVVPAHTFVATAHAVRYTGAEVTFCDSASVMSPNLSAETVERAITPATKAVIAVHMWGYSAEVEKIRALCDQRGLTLIEDCAEAICARTPEGSPVGSVGHIGCFSLFSKKQLAVGEGGAVSTDDPEIAASARSLRSHAMSSVTWERHKGHGLGYDVTDVGFNYRIDEPRAALGLSRIKRLNADIERRRAVAGEYREALVGLDGIDVPYSDDEVSRSSHFAFPVFVDPGHRDRVREALKADGIQTSFYPGLHSLSEYASIADEEDLPVATDVAKRHLVLPIHASLDSGTVRRVAESLNRAVQGTG